MKLALIIENLSSSDSRTIVAKRPWSEVSEAQLVSLSDEYRVPSDVSNEGFKYFLEVALRGQLACGQARRYGHEPRAIGTAVRP